MSWPHLAGWFPLFLRNTRGVLDVALYHSYTRSSPTRPTASSSCRRRAAIPTCRGGGGSPRASGESGAGAARASSRAAAHCAATSRAARAAGGGDAGVRAAAAGDRADGRGRAALERRRRAVQRDAPLELHYVDALGVLARKGHGAFVRQTLAGGNYELPLLDRCSTHETGGGFVTLSRTLTTTLRGLARAHGPCSRRRSRARRGTCPRASPAV